jgi:hypothetical protein
MEICAASKIISEGKKDSIVGPGRAVLVLSSPPKVLNAESELFKGVLYKISGEVVGVIDCIPTDKPWIVGV